MNKTFTLLFFLMCQQTVFGQLTTDHSYHPTIATKTYPNDDGTIVYIDEAHNNHHMHNEDYIPLSRILTSDGYSVKVNTRRFSAAVLKDFQILLLASPQPDSLTDDFKTLPTPDILSPEEVVAVKEWVRNGGSLLLVADHMPLAGTINSLASAFGFTVYNSFVMRSPTNGIIDFNISNGTLNENSTIVKGRDESESISWIRTFTGHGFSIPENAESVLRLTASETVYLTKETWNFDEVKDEFSAEGLSQGAILTYGKGKVAFFGEATMFKSRLWGKKKIGMNHKKAKENYQLLLNTIHWLDDKL
ncbi:MAG: DUF4350 domain-containing protein [Bacteroidota bacterium]